MFARRGPKAWLDDQMVLAVPFLNLAGGDCVDDIERLECDEGFAAIFRAIESDAQARRAILRTKKFKAYQPLNCWLAEQGLMVHSEFRDGNVPAGHQQLRVLKDCLPPLPETVKKVSPQGFG